ncbi:MAG: hypothetical protein JST40_06750 [Armatimonadetes bacterium]|nr:hypothetical protein [Armatimonadota bacterium]
MKRSWFVFAIALAGTVAEAHPADISTTNKLRKVLLDVARADAEKYLGTKVLWKVNRIRARGDLAYLSLEPLMPNGKPMDFTKTKLKNEWKESRESGVWESGFNYLLRKSSGKWKIIERETAGQHGDTQIGEWANNIKGAKPLILDE